MALTIYDIAKEANVSITTVSRVLNNKGDVSEKTKQRIQKILDERGYAPSQLARGLANKSTKTIGVLAVDIRDVHHSTIVYHMERTLSTGGYSCIVCNLGGKKERLGDYLDMLTSRQVDGIVFVGSVFADEVCRKQLEEKGLGIPCVIVNAMLPYPGCYSVLDSEEEATAETVDYMVREKGRRNIVLVYDYDTMSEKRKRQGYKDGMERNGLGGKVLEANCRHTMESGMEVTQNIMRQYPDTDAIIYTKDLTAVGGIHTLQDLGYRVPEDVAVIGMNNSIYAKLCRPTLTSLDNKPEETGQAAVKLLVKVLEGQEILEPYIIPCVLKKRGSA